MGTKVHSETILPGRYHHSMRDLNNDSNGCSRLPFLNNDQSYKDVVRRTMLEHEAVFKSQVNYFSLWGQLLVDYMFCSFSSLTRFWNFTEYTGYKGT